MKENNTYIGFKVKNQFTAYLLEFIRGKRRDYIGGALFINFLLVLSRIN